MDELITEISNIPFKGLFKTYINQGLEENPDVLFKELYEQISLNYNASIDLMGERVVNLVLLYIEGNNIMPQTYKNFFIR